MRTQPPTSAIPLIPLQPADNINYEKNREKANGFLQINEHGIYIRRRSPHAQVIDTIPMKVPQLA